MKWPFGKKQPSQPVYSPVRARNMATLKDRGFVVAPFLPDRDPDFKCTLRPVDELAGRLAALNALFIYATAPESAVPSSRLLDHIEAADLHSHMTPEEVAILDLDRSSAADKHGNAIGWRTENAVALAWVLGREGELAFDGTMLGGDQIRPLVTQRPRIDATGYKAWVATLRPRPNDEVAAMQDLFYCAHNAARSAQVQMLEARGKPVRYETVPPGFDPVVNGGVIHERRHSLTWALSPGEAWEETDLST
jgi:hypothetical protein